MNHPPGAQVRRLPPSMNKMREASSCARKILTPLLRLLLAAGLSRQQVLAICEKSVRNLAEPVMHAPIKALPDCNPLADTVARWANHPAYLDRGKPMRLQEKGGKPSFQSLVKAAAPNMPASSVLRALRRAGVLRVARDGRLELLSHFYPMRSSGAVDIQIFTKMIVDFLRTHEINILKNPRLGRGLFQRMAHNVKSDARLAPAFNRYVREQGQLFLETIDEWLVRHQPKRGGARTRKRTRLGVGIYVINEALR